MRARRGNQRIPVKHIAGRLLGILLLGLALWVIASKVQSFSLQSILDAARRIPASCLAAAAMLTALNYLFVTGYDWLGVYLIKRRIAPLRLLLVSFIATTFGLNLGMALFSSGSIRYRFYSEWGVSAKQIAFIILFRSLTLWMGFVAWGGIVFHFITPSPEALKYLPENVFHLLSWGFLCIFLVYVVANGFYRKPIRISGRELPAITPKVMALQFFIAMVDWLNAAGVLYFLFPGRESLGFIELFGIFLLAMVMTAASNVPAGLGVVEGVFLVLLSRHLTASEILAGLLVYRLVYNFIPFLIAIGVMFACEGAQYGRALRVFFRK